MLTRDSFVERFGSRPVFGMVHLRPLPGAPLYQGDLDEVLAHALQDARTIASGGAAGLMVENFGDRPFGKTVRPETVAAMTRVVTEIRREVAIPVGVNMLRNDGAAALAVAVATGADLIRINILVGVMVTDQGVIEGEAAEILRLRKMLGGERVAIFADHLVKHAVPLGAGDALQMAKDLRLRGLADAVVLSGAETGAEVDHDRLGELREHLDAPLVIGSGLTESNAGKLAELADGAIVGTSIKSGGDVEREVDVERVRAVVRAFRGGR